MDNATTGVEGLFAEMPSRRRVLKGILSFLDEPRSAESLREEVERLQEHDFSVYTSADYAGLLEETGAIRRVNADGSMLDPSEVKEPELVDIEDEQYWRPAPKRQVYWVATDEARACLAKDDPVGRMNGLLEAESALSPVIERILTMCADEDGRGIAEISACVDIDPLMKESGKYAPYLVERLERCDALCWEGAWKTTHVGELALEILAGISTGEGGR